MIDINKFILHLTNHLSIQGIVCYGSYALALNDEKSDIDLLILMKEEIPNQQIRRQCYQQFPALTVISYAEETMNAGNWDNSWSPVNDKLILHHQPLDIGYNTTTWVDKVINNLIIKQQTSFPEFPFRPYSFLGLLESAKIFYDKDDFIQNHLKKIRPMPLTLKEKIIREFLPILIESHQELLDYSERNIGILAFQFHLGRGLDALEQVLFAINNVYHPASKYIEYFLLRLKYQPPGLADFIHSTLPKFYENKKAVVDFFKTALDFIENKTLNTTG